MVQRTEVTFMSGGERCAAWLYQPGRSSGTSPCVVMAHGTTGTRDLGLAPYAERFAAAGCAVLVFDYRHFGASAGQPRQLVHIGHQLQDWREAITFARRLPQVDPQRIALWGTSLSAGHVVAVAAEDPTVAAVVAQLPWMGFTWHRGAAAPPLRVTAALLTAIAADCLRGLVGRPPRMIPMVGAPGDVAVFTGSEDSAVLRDLAADAPQWRNAIAARSVLSLMRYRPAARAARLTMPLLVCVAENDDAASVPMAVAAGEKAPHGEVRSYPGGHFAGYVGPVFEQMVADETTFLVRSLFDRRSGSPVVLSGS